MRYRSDYINFSTCAGYSSFIQSLLDAEKNRETSYISHLASDWGAVVVFLNKKRVRVTVAAPERF